jgi:alkanesulfonate monooxygenase SsuD/methylene tetrahydromethanopterin reductase-like flavin-dependent oxidoreductase (luciferase family)
VRLGLALPTFGPDARPEGIVRVCRTAEDMGYDSLWTGDPLPRRAAAMCPQMKKDVQ